MSKIIIKNEEQIAGIRASSKLAAKTLEYIRPFVQPGVKTEVLDAKIEEFIRSHNAIPATLNYSGFPKSCCISLNEVVCHGIPSSRELKDGDILNIDVTTILNGYFGDTSKMYTVGKVNNAATKLIKATERALEIGIEQVRPDNHLGNIGFEIDKYIRTKGYSVVYEYCGHGVGIQFHEPPQIEHSAPQNSGPKLFPGMIFTIEPMINQGVPHVITSKIDGWTVTTKDKKLSAQFEHTVLVTEDGYEILTQV
ncbi:MAG: type I methionyl aminopeptidase [Melioribacteraceae bacterium]|nr:type I methionyl aminopeptidase [Melioribacteraceae bacterium]